MTQHKMPLLDQIVNLFAVVIPFLATIAAIILFWNQIVTPLDLALFLGMYMLTTFGITIGFHRLLTHRSFQTFKPIEYFLAIAGSMAVEGPVNTWVADHRKHHAHTDEEGDPHSPHVGHGGGIKGVLKGLFHAHIGWTFTDHGKAEQEKYAKDLYEDRGMRFISDFFVLWVVLGLLIPAGIGYLVTGTLAGAASGFLWAGWSASSSSTTSPSRSTRSATSWARGASRSTITRPTSSGWRSPQWARPGTTTITPFPARPTTA